MIRRPFAIALLAAGLGVCAGCRQWFLNEADREVYDLIQSRQQAALGETHSADIGTETGDLRTSDQMYDFAPHPVDPTVPEEFRGATALGAETDQPTTAPADPVMPGFGPVPEHLDFTLADCLAYAQRHAREYQTAKEELYLSALALSLERFLWTPQLASQLSYEFADYGQVRDFDRAMTATATMAAQQRLPLGGEVTARVINEWMRDLKAHTTSSETGAMILSADIPLLRGAGRVAYESRYQSERDLIYAVRDFERFRREFLVDIAGEFFRLLSQRTAIESNEAQVASLQVAFERAQAMAEAERVLQVEADRARVELLLARNRVAGAQEIFGRSLDQFKIRLNMPIDVPLEIVDQELDLHSPDVPESLAVATAAENRLDLLNLLDAVDDARRGVKIAENNLLPDFNFVGSVRMDTDPNKPSVVEYNTERTTWRGLLELEVPVNRQRERNEYRSSFIDLRRAERAYDIFREQVQAEVRRVMRQLILAEITISIQRENIVINEFRRRQASTLFDLGQLQSNRDLIEAENDLRDAKNILADAIAEYRRTILEFLLSTGTLRVGDDGSWESFPDPDGVADMGG